MRLRRAFVASAPTIARQPLRRAARGRLARAVNVARRAALEQPALDPAARATLARESRPASRSHPHADRRTAARTAAPRPPRRRRHRSRRPRFAGSSFRRPPPRIAAAQREQFRSAYAAASAHAAGRMEKARRRARRLSALSVPRSDGAAPQHREGIARRRRTFPDALARFAARKRRARRVPARARATRRLVDIPRVLERQPRSRPAVRCARRAHRGRRETRFREGHRAALDESAHVARRMRRRARERARERHADRRAASGRGSSTPPAAGNEDSAAAAAAMLERQRQEAADRIVAAVQQSRRDARESRRSGPIRRAHRDAIAYGLARYARRDSASAETLWAKLGDKFKWDDAQKNRVLNALAVYRSTSYSPDALARLKALPPDAEDDMSREWHVRIALAIGDCKETLAALDDLSAHAEGRFALAIPSRARPDQARPQDRSRADLRRCRARSELPRIPCRRLDRTSRMRSARARSRPIPPSRKPSRAQADLARAFEFQTLGMLPEARREWDFAHAQARRSRASVSPPISPTASGWYDRAVFFYSADPETQRLYEQRFPLALETRVKREASGAGIDPAWAYAIIRAESAWMTDAHSHADAYGLMQLLPGVAKQHGEIGETAVQPAERPVRSDAQRRARHALSRSHGRPLRRQSMARERGLQRRRSAGRALARRARLARSRFLHRDDSVQGNARIRRPRARLQRDLRLAHERQGASRSRRACRASARPMPRRPTPRRAKASPVRPSAAPTVAPSPPDATAPRATTPHRSARHPVAARFRSTRSRSSSMKPSTHRDPRRHRLRRQPSRAAAARRRPHDQDPVAQSRTASRARRAAARRASSAPTFTTATRCARISPAPMR